MQSEQILDRASKVADQAEVLFIKSEQTPVSFEANRLKQIITRESSGFALRIIKNGRIGFAAATGLDDPQVLIDSALEMAQFGAEAKFEFPGVSQYPPVNVYDPTVEQVPIEQMVDIGAGMIRRIIAYDKAILCEAGVSRSTATVEIINSRGGQASYRKSGFSISIEGTLIQENDMLFVGDGQSACEPILNSDKVVENTIQQLTLAKRHATVTSKQMPVIFVPRAVVGALISPLASAMNGKTVLLGASPLGDKQGQQMFDEKLSIWDDALVDLRPGSEKCDDEGIPKRKITLVDKGVVGEFLYDLQTAGLAGKTTTGSASRSLESLPSPSISALAIGEGQMSQDEMVADIEEGIIVWQLMGAGQGNVLGGDFSGNVLLGYKIEKGEIVGRVKNTMVAGNIYSVLKNIVAMGSVAEWVWGSIRVPAMYIGSLGVSTKG